MFMKNDLTVFYTDDDQEDLDFFKEIIDIIDDKVLVITQNNAGQLFKDLDNPPPTPHVVFLDINMPGINGFEVLKKLRATGPYKDLPIVMFSTSSDDATIKKSRELGASLYVPKSSIFENLRKSIEFVLNINWSTFIPTEKNFVYHS
jgi:CheY-like chemotaxis protein